MEEDYLFSSRAMNTALLDARPVTGGLPLSHQTPIGPIRLGAFTLHLAFSEGRFEGIGAVFFEDTALRSAALPWIVYSESEQGMRFCRFEMIEVLHRDEDSVTLHFRSEGEWLPRVQDADSMGDARVKARRVRKPSAEFWWTFRRTRERVWENECEGLAMQMEIKSPKHPLHWMIETATWEIGGSAEGCTLIQQDISTMDLEQTVNSDSAFSTIERFFTEGWGGAYPMDMLPRAAGAAICDFQTKGDLAICLFAERPSLTRARIEKFADESVIHYTDRPFFSLAENVKTPERKLIVYRHPAPLKRHEWRNLWLDCFTEVRRRILEPYRFQTEAPLPIVWSHLWDAELKKLGAKWTDELRNALPRFKSLGFREVATHGVWDSITSDPNPPENGSICCPYQFRFAESFGGEAGMKGLSDAARNVGMELFQWFSFHLSRHAEVWKEHPDWILKEANGDPWDGAYQCLWSGRFRSGYGAWMKNMVKETCQGAKLDGVFWDSYQNLGVTCVDWSAPDKSPQAEEIWEFQAELQRLGIRQRCEIVTIFGVSNVAVYGFESDKFRRRLWSTTVDNDDIFALFDTAPAFFTKAYPFTKDRINPESYFWMLAHRVVPPVGANPWTCLGDTAIPSVPGGEFAEEYGRVNHYYNEALPMMKRLRLVEHATHTLWLDEEGQPSVIWVFKKAKVRHCGTARELREGREVHSDEFLEVHPGQVWILGNH